MALVATRRAADRYTIKYLLTEDGATGGIEADLTIQNADLVDVTTGMVDGPLRDLFTQVYGTQAAARLALTEGEHMEVIGPNPVRESARGGSGEGEAWAVDVNIDGNGLPTLTIFGDASGHPRILQLNYRHSTGR